MRVQDKRTGLIVEFPDGTDPAIIAKAMQSLGQQGAAALGAGTAERFSDAFAPAQEASPRLQVQAAAAGVSARRGSMGGLDDVVRSIARGVPILGALADRADPQPERDAAFAKAHPILAPALEIGGGIASLGAAAGAIPGAATALGIKGPALLRPIMGGVTGAGLGAGDAAIRGDDPGEAAKWGAAFGAAAPVVGQAVGRAVAGRVARRAIPTTEQRGQMATQAFKEAEQAGVTIGRQSIDTFARDLAGDVLRQGYRPALHPRIAEGFKAMEEFVARGQMTIEDAHYLRRVFQSAGKSPDNPDQGRLAGLMVDKLDDYIGGLTARDIAVGGDPSKAVTAMRSGIDNWRIMRKGQVIEDIWEKARNQAGANYTNAGMETALRQQFRALANNQRRFAQFTREERTAILKVVRGGPVQNLWRLIGKFAPSGLVSATMSGGAGYALGGPVGSAAMMGAGALGKQIATQMTMRNAGLVDSMVRAGGRLPQPAANAGRAADEATTALLQGAFIPALPRWATSPVPQVPVKR